VRKGYRTYVNRKITSKIMMRSQNWTYR